jgi:hypothetical protein
VSGLASALYTGIVRHRRFVPRPHSFRYRVFMLYLDLGELDRAFRGRWLWSAHRPNLVRFDRRDHVGPAEEPLDASVRRLVAEHTGFRPDGPIRLLTHPRYFGFCFNPVSFYYCFDADDRRLETIVAEIHNTPWGERHCYVLPAGEPARHHRFRFRKAFHVSPFLAMDYDYDWRFTPPGERLAVHMRNERDGERDFDASLSLERRPLDGPNMARALANHPFMTGKVIAAIYWQALRLWLKGTPFHPHPDKRTDSTGAG